MSVATTRTAMIIVNGDGEWLYAVTIEQRELVAQGHFIKA